MSQRGQSPLESRMFATSNDLPESVRRGSVQLLNELLADTADVRSQLKYAHWNVKGLDFYQLHLLFDEIAEDAEDHQDVLAERATALGGEAKGTVRMAAARSSVAEVDVLAVEGPQYLQTLVSNYGAYAARVRQAISQSAQAGDEDTADLLTEISREVDKNLWFLEAHLQSQPRGSVSGQQASASQLIGGRQMSGQQVGGQQTSGQQFGDLHISSEQSQPAPTTEAVAASAQQGQQRQSRYGEQSPLQR